MATDPLQRVRTLKQEMPLTPDLQGALMRIAALPPSTEAPYLTVSLDWRPEGSEPGLIPAPPPKRSERLSPADVPGLPRRPSWQQVSRELDALVAERGPRGAEFDSLGEDVAKIAAYLDGELDPAAQGVIIVACAHQGVFEPIPLDVPVETSIATGPIPSFRHLIHAADDFPRFAVLVADKEDAILWIMERRTWESGIQLEANDYPRHQQTGGWSQRRLQSRADERTEAFARAVATETREALGDGATGIPYLIVAAEDQFASALDAQFDEVVTARKIARLPSRMDRGPGELAEESRPLVAAEERRREDAAVTAVRDGVGAGTDGVASAEATLAALQAGQVMRLVLNDDFSGAGWADYTLPLAGVGKPPAEHPAGGDVMNIVPVALADELVRLALQGGAAVEQVQTSPITGAEDLAVIPQAGEAPPRASAALALDALGGVGAILRFALNQDEG